MPRDFVPCLYDEREMYDEATQTWHRRYEVVEAFSVMEVATHEPLCLVSLESHAYHVDVTFTACGYDALPPDEHAQLDHNERTQLFTTFYAAMAALE